MNILHRLENLALAILALGVFWTSGGNWWLFAILILAPDLAFLGYMHGHRTGAIFYNILHSWLGPILFAMLGWTINWQLFTTIALIWAVHIGVDRALGFGLKKMSSFPETPR